MFHGGEWETGHSMSTNTDLFSSQTLDELPEKAKLQSIKKHMSAKQHGPQQTSRVFNKCIFLLKYLQYIYVFCVYYINYGRYSLFFCYL